MKVTGFSFIKNALIYDYPIVEAIKSVLSICDEFVVAVGDSDDATLQLIESIDPQKIKIVRTTWDESMREGGRILAIETDKAFAAISSDTDWAFYIQGDEVMHEQYLKTVYDAMQRHLNDPKIDGLLFNYLHFYGSYDYVAASPQWYDREIRVIRHHKNIYSYRDAQGFRKNDDEKLCVKPIDAAIYHYGWVKEPQAMQRKQENFHKYWHDAAWIAQNVVKAEAFDYVAHIDELRRFTATHPAVMQARIAAKNWQFDYDISFNKTSFKSRCKQWLKQYLHLDFRYKNYKIG
jgi:glycosyltransferase involved in cell wall biosynthesis